MLNHAPDSAASDRRALVWARPCPDVEGCPYYSLTSDQVQKVTTLYSDYSTFRAAKNTRMSELNRDLSNQFLQPVLDPAQIGASYVEAEAIRRDLVNRENSYRSQVGATLTQAQQVKYQSLLNSITLQPLLNDAACAFLEDNIVNSGILVFGTSPATFLLGVPVSVTVPYIPPPPGPMFCNSRVFPIDLREYLNPTDAQIAAIVQANPDYNDVYQRRQNRIADVKVEIRDETSINGC